ncbi:hypothetical protein [Brevibacterium sp. HMSC22B09]|uniref:hypothetical protein n=1 Tax=Brevibacterium sp. HMSC22B09 TaxID=1581055 RepID=UPI00114D228B|nr:hypothetical protein [Brevibacterium sp. HMSC22B09]
MTQKPISLPPVVAVAAAALTTGLLLAPCSSASPAHAEVGEDFTAMAPKAVDSSSHTPGDLRYNGGEIEVVAGGDSILITAPPPSASARTAVPVPHCGYKAKNRTKVATYSRAGVKGFGGNKAYLRCGSYGKAGWGLRHIGERHKSDWENKAAGSGWYDMMEFATKQALKKPKSATRQANDTYAYCAPIELRYNGKVYDRFAVKAPVSHGGKNVITSYPTKKC